MPGSSWCASWPAGSALAELLDRVTVKKRKRGYSPAQTILGLCETLIAGGECLDDVAVLRADSAQELLRGHRLPVPTTLGRFLRRFSLGHIGQLNRALDALFARVHLLVGRWTVTLDLDATYIEHHGPVGSRQGTRGTYKGKVSWHPLLCFAGETGEWLHAKLRNGHAAASTGATRFLASACAGCPRTRGCSCEPTRASGAKTSSPTASAGRSPTPSERR